MALHVDAQAMTVDYPDTDGLPMAESDFQRKPLTYAVEAEERASQEAALRRDAEARIAELEAQLRAFQARRSPEEA
jgi:hypothetical protein